MVFPLHNYLLNLAVLRKPDVYCHANDQVEAEMLLNMIDHMAAHIWLL